MPTPKPSESIRRSPSRADGSELDKENMAEEEARLKAKRDKKERKKEKKEKKDKRENKENRDDSS